MEKSAPLIGFYTDPAHSDVLRLDMRLVGLPANISEMRTRIDKATFERIEGVDKKQLHITKPIFDDHDDQMLRKALSVPDSEQGVFTREYNRYLNLQNKYVIRIWSNGNFILRECVPDFVGEVEQFNKDLQKLRQKVLSILESRHYERSQLLRFNPRVNYGIYVLTLRQDSDNHFRKWKERAIRKYLDNMRWGGGGAT